MDRPIAIADMVSMGATGNIRTVEACTAASLAEQVNAIIATWAASGQSFPFLSGWEITGGGGGSTWRATLTFARAIGWGINTSIPASIARFRCATARNRTEMIQVAGRLLAQIAAEEPDAYVWGQRVASSGRDGTYLVCVLYTNTAGIGGAPTYYEFVDAPATYAVPTVVLGFTLPACVTGNVNSQRIWLINYAIEYEDTPGASGVSAELLIDTVVSAQENGAFPAGQWNEFSGFYIVGQSPAGTTTIELQVSPGGASVSERRAKLCAHLIHSQFSGG